MSVSDLFLKKGSFFKPPKGTSLMETRDRRKGRTQKEDEQKDECRDRDKRCRLPHCPYCRSYKNLVPQAAHVLEAKGIGGDPTNVRSDVSMLMLLDPLAHAAQERHEWEIEPLTSDGTDGVCAFYLCSDVYDPETGRFSRERHLWDREVAIGVAEHKAPLVKMKPLRRQKEQD